LNVELKNALKIQKSKIIIQNQDVDVLTHPDVLFPLVLDGTGTTRFTK